MATFSPTRIKAFWTCPQKYVFDLNADEPSDDRSYFDLGKAVHSYAESYIRVCWLSKSDSDYEVGEELIYAVLNNLDPSLWYEFTTIAWDYMHTHMFGAEPDVGGLETKLAINWDHEPCDYEDKNALMRGRVDRWWLSDGRLLISDIKTNRLIQSRDQVESDLQLLSYAYLGWMHHKEDIYEVRVQLEFVRHTDDGNPVVIHAVFPVERLEKFHDWLNSRAVELNQINAGARVPKCKPGEEHANCKLYGGCPHIHQCPHWEGYAPPELITCKEDAAKMQAWAKWVKAEGAKIDRQVKAWVDHNGEVDGHGVVTKVSKAKRYDYDGETVWRVYQEQGKTAEDFAKVAGIKASAIPKKIKSAVQAELEPKISTKVTVAKAT
jgi:hypothetical protein